MNKNMKSRPLWHEDKTFEEIALQHDSRTAIINLHEDILCLKEDIEDLKKELAKYKTDGGELPPSAKKNLCDNCELSVTAKCPDPLLGPGGGDRVAECKDHKLPRR